MATRLVSVSEAADVLGLPVSGVEALIGAGYLRPRGSDLLSSAEVESFHARNAAQTDDAVADLFADVRGVDIGAGEILAALEASVPEMASRAADIVTGVFPDAGSWTDAARADFERQARQRFAAILAVTQAVETDESLLTELERAGSAAAFAGAPLPQVLLTMRVSRDLLVQTAVSAAEDLGKEWGLALAVVLTQVLPVLDRLTDSIAAGYWSAVVLREQESVARFEHVVEHSASGVYEIDLSGVVRYANPTMAVICGVGIDELVDRDLLTTLPPADHLDIDVYATPTDGWRPLRVQRADGVVREIQLQISARSHEGATVGFDGVVRDVTAPRALERHRTEFLRIVTEELRQPATQVLGLGATLAAHADELPRDRIARIGDAIGVQAERLLRLADDVADVARIRADELQVTLRRVPVRPVLDAALRMLSLRDPDQVLVDVEDHVAVTADLRRLEQVLAHLIENGLQHGVAPVVCEVRTDDGMVQIRVSDRGPGVAGVDVADLFAGVRPTTGDGSSLATRAWWLGLPLVRALVEAMGGRIRYEHGDPGAVFIVTLPAASDV